jgi:hypothetical protein
MPNTYSQASDRLTKNVLKAVIAVMDSVPASQMGVVDPVHDGDHGGGDPAEGELSREPARSRESSDAGPLGCSDAKSKAFRGGSSWRVKVHVP